MADLTGITVPEMPSAGSVGNADYFMIVQSGVNKKAPKSLVLDGIATEDETGNKVDLEINSSTYVMVAKLYDKNNNLLSTSSPIDLPLETMVVGAEYDEETKEIVLTLKNGTTVRFSVADLIDGLVSQETFDEAIEALQNEISDLAAQIVTTETKEGTEFTINDTFDARMKVKIKGNTEQDSYSGKNKLNIIDFASQTISGITFTKNNDGSITISGTATANITFRKSITATLLKAITYAFSQTTTTSASAFAISLRTTDESVISGTPLDSGTSSKTFTPSAEIWANYFQIYVNSGRTIDTTIYPMLEEGSVATEYEQYVGGTASPNPDFPQSVKVVTGNNSVVVSNNTNFTLENGGITGNDGQPVSASGRIRTADYITIDENTTNIFMSCDNAQNYKARIYCYDANNTYLGNTDSLAVLPRQKNIATGTKKIKIALGFLDDRAMTTSNVSNIIISDLQQTLPLHLGTEYLAKIGDYQDYITGSKDNWKIKKYVGKVILPNNIGSYNSSNNWYYIAVGSLGLSNPYLKELLSTHFTYYDPNTFKSDNNLNGISTNTSGTYVLIRNTECTDATEYRTFLTNNDVYIIAYKENEIPITDQTLIQDLNAIADARSYVGQTNVNSTYESGNVPMIINATALTGGLLYKSAIVTSISAASTDEQVPSAKCVYGIVGDINTLLDNLNGEVI